MDQPVYHAVDSSYFRRWFPKVFTIEKMDGLDAHPLNRVATRDLFLEWNFKCASFVGSLDCWTPPLDPWELVVTILQNNQPL